MGEQKTPTTETSRSQTASIFGGALAVLGLVMLAITNGLFELDWAGVWPIFPLLVGVGLLFATLESPQRHDRGAFVTVGTFLLTTALFFFTITLGFFEWGDMEKLWPVFLLNIGIGIIAAYFASGQRSQYRLLTSFLFVSAGTVSLLILQLSEHADMSKLWPVFVVAAGLIILVAPTLSGGKKR